MRGVLTSCMLLCEAYWQGVCCPKRVALSYENRTALQELYCLQESHRPTRIVLFHKKRTALVLTGRYPYRKRCGRWRRSASERLTTAGLGPYRLRPTVLAYDAMTTVIAYAAMATYVCPAPAMRCPVVS
eukprot:483830-Rhodomonas_salina.1